MTDARVTSLNVEVIRQPEADVRVTGVVLEVLRSVPTPPPAGPSGNVVLVIFSG